VLFRSMTQTARWMCSSSWGMTGLVTTPCRKVFAGAERCSVHDFNTITPCLILKSYLRERSLASAAKQAASLCEARSIASDVYERYRDLRSPASAVKQAALQGTLFTAKLLILFHQIHFSIPGIIFSPFYTNHPILSGNGLGEL
jgi:hypothetical protein